MINYSFVSTQLKRQSLTQKKPHESYLNALKLFWNSEYEKALKEISNFVEVSLDDVAEDSCAGYRLWIEILKQDNDMEGLLELEQHLANMVDVGISGASLLSLQGIIKLELDEIQGVKLILNTLGSRFSNNIYYVELKTRLDIYTNGIDKWIFMESKEENNYNDYFHWELIAKKLYMKNEKEHLVVLLDAVSEIFPGCPLKSRFQILEGLNKGKYLSVSHVSQTLADAYPGNLENIFILAYSLMQCGKRNRAIEILETFGDIDNQTELKYLYSICLDDMDNVAGNEGLYRDKVNTLFEDLMFEFKASNMPTYDISLRQQELTNGSPGSSTEMKSWFIGVGSSDYYFMLNEETADLTLTGVQKSEIGRGNLCFVGRVSQDNSSINLAGLYKAKSGPIYNPLSGGYDVHLERFFKPMATISINVQLSEDSTSELQMKNQKLFLELDDKAFERVFEPFIERYENEIEKLCSELKENNSELFGYINNIFNKIRVS